LSCSAVVLIGINVQIKSRQSKAAILYLFGSVAFKVPFSSFQKGRYNIGVKFVVTTDI
jgi:hypothetical protein